MPKNKECVRAHADAMAAARAAAIALKIDPERSPLVKELEQREATIPEQDAVDNDPDTRKVFLEKMKQVQEAAEKIVAAVNPPPKSLEEEAAQARSAVRDAEKTLEQAQEALHAQKLRNAEKTLEEAEKTLAAQKALKAQKALDAQKAAAAAQRAEAEAETAVDEAKKARDEAEKALEAAQPPEPAAP